MTSNYRSKILTESDIVELSTVRRTIRLGSRQAGIEFEFEEHQFGSSEWLAPDCELKGAVRKSQVQAFIQTFKKWVHFVS